jgi:hypothetical protein
MTEEFPSVVSKKNPEKAPLGEDELVHVPTIVASCTSTDERDSSSISAAII